MEDSPPSSDLSADLSAVPVFPLPSVVLLPTAVLPLHIFEQRYRAMTKSALAGDRQIAMALLSPGWQKTYAARPAIEPVVCVGTIISYEQLPDGKYNFLLQGRSRARIVKELATNESFRRLQLEPIIEIPADESSLMTARQTFNDVFESGFLAGTALGQTFAKLLNSKIKTVDIADLIAFNCFEDLQLKQQLLGEGDAARRVEIVVRDFLALEPPKPWPPPGAFRNPSVN